MIILERYLFKRAVVHALGSLVSLVAIVWIVQALSRIDIVKTSASAAGNVFWIALMLLPDLASGVLPFAVLIGSVQALNALNADSERTVIAASGASSRVVARPIILIGLIGGVVMLLTSNFLSPLASHAFQNGIRSINADAITLFLTPGRFEQVQDDVVIGIDSVNGSTVKGLVIADHRDPMMDMTYFAREARIIQKDQESLLLLFDGQLHRRNTTDNSVAIIEFQTYAFDLAALRPSADSQWTRSSEISTPELIFPTDPASMSERDMTKYHEELTDRLTNWLYAIAFALWAVVVAGQPTNHRQGTGGAMALGLTGALGLKALGFVAISQIENGTIWIAISFILPLGAILFDAILIQRNFDPQRWSPLNRLSEGVRNAASALASFGTPKRAGGRG